MAGKNRAVSPLSNGSYESNYSDDFEDDDAHSNRRYKTRSPALRTDKATKRGPPHSIVSNSTLNISKYTQDIRIVRDGRVAGRTHYNGNSSAGTRKTSTTNYRSTDRHYHRDSQDTTPDTYRTKETGSSAMWSKPVNNFNRSNRSNRGRGRGGRLGRGSQQTGRSSMEPKIDNIAKRVMSARRLKINELKNTNEELIQQIRDLKDENKLLKKTQFRTEKALQRFEDKESDLPQIMQRQQNEVRSLKDQIRKWREKHDKTDRYLRDAEDELEKVKFKLKKLKSVTEEKGLPERSELNKRLTQAELDIEERDVKIKELERHLQNTQKNHRHELGIERARQKDSNKKFMELREENEKLEIVIKEKEKELQMKNIYANRMIKPPHHLPNSYNGTPTPPVKQRRPSLSEGMTPREKAKMMEEKRREDLRKQREMKERRRQRSYKSNFSDSVLPQQLSVDGSPRQNNEYLSPRNKQPKQQQKMKREKELRTRQEEEDRERERQENEERERRAWEEKERLMDQQARRDEEDRRNQEERERMKRESEERERKERLKREREEQERWEREKDRERKEREERERRERREREEKERRERERLEQERRAKEEMDRLENDEDIQAERRKKDLILQKLREIDEGGQKEEKKKDHFFVTSPREDTMDSQSSKRSYNFSRPTENLHRGKPSRDDLSFGGSHSGRKKNIPNKSEIDGLEKGGYNPSFVSSNKGAQKSTKNFSLFDDDISTTKTSNKTANKSKLMEDLFGSKDESGPKRNDLFDSKSSKKTGKSSDRSGFPWDDEPNKIKDSGSKRENSSQLFGGGSALINDNDFQTSSKNATMRRPKQTTTTFTRPTVQAVAQFDDDIEEVIL